MKANEYLKSKLSDEFSTASDIETRTALAAYAIKIFNEVGGYSLSEAEKIIKPLVRGEKELAACLSFISDACSFMQVQSRIPNLED